LGSEVKNQSRFRLDHVVILVKNLDAAMTQYCGLGFNVFAGGEHAGGLTSNALIAFADGSYLELLAFRAGAGRGSNLRREQESDGSAPDAQSSLSARFMHRRAVGEGLVDFALASESLSEDIRRARLSGLDLSGPARGGRYRPDGRELRWLTALPSSFDLPFLIQDETERVLRVPTGEVTTHSNGAGGISGVTVAVNDLDLSLARYDSLLGIDSRAEHSPNSDPIPIRYRLERGTITLLSRQTNSDVANYVTHRPDRPYSIGIFTNKPERAGILHKYASGGRIVLTPGGGIQHH